ncbi:VOC family protein [Listeria ivanovii]|uniref:VOC family protein n=2 Tax=Listeria ivanovii TaxID=1638 RepID=A0ABS1G3U4_LISIV|nr:VOC family protein [Listeria ivanovii]AIS59241.1 glyoxalase/bleomycin resistance protein/dioxygenase [Listeria ivanovii subsp. londoniensis]AIS62076.1 glyoxalase/bleomycin resistance protein/dioxygenase [Listeria ivanovii subsp. londoniensis]MBC2254902.1 VOC family protein [Listeria ivanovii]MBK1961545.1 VOC family protein [Listeria ivanovii subsp. londoniensis]MBK1965555.1 VOC family protein [Listeria ivanovii subsp. londoniensis]
MPFAVPYLVFNGEGQEALIFYSEVFVAEITNVQRFKEMNHFDGDAVFGERLMHSRLAKNGEEFIYITDTPYEGFTTGNRVTILINFESKSELKRAYEALLVGGKVEMELQVAFWGSTYAQVTDKFGVFWQLNFG